MSEENEGETKIAVCAVGESDAENLGEWIEYHVGIGIDKIMLYNNGTADDMKFKVDPKYMQGETVDDFVVQIIDFPNQPEYKRKAYADCFKKLKDNFDWIACIDIDKFIALPVDETIKTIFQDLNEKYQEFEQIRLNSIMFSDERKLSMDLNLPGKSANSMIVGPYMAKTIVNCKAEGFEFTEYCIKRNGTPTTQCLPDASELEPSNEKVPKLDLSTMYLTSSYMEILWIGWKREKGY